MTEESESVGEKQPTPVWERPKSKFSEEEMYEIWREIVERLGEKIEKGEYFPPAHSQGGPR